MGLDIFFGEDIRNALLAADKGGNPSLEQIRTILYQHQAGMDTVVTGAYKAGYAAALVTLALAFGLSPNILRGKAQQSNDHSLLGLARNAAVHGGL